MTDTNINRRNVLRGAAAGAAATGFAGEAAAGRLPDRIIVGLTADTPFSLARQAADRIHRELDFGRVGKAVAGEFPTQAVRAFDRHPKVRYVEEDGTVHALAQTLPWGIDRVDADRLHSDGETGSGADVAIIDTGIDGDHPDLQANVGSGRAFVSCSGCNHAWTDDNGHGTHCAGIADADDNSRGVVGVSTEATLHAVKVLDSQGSGSFSDVAAGIEYVADRGWDVGSLSLGGSSGSAALQDAVQYATNNGVLLVAAAGNGYGAPVSYPAAYPEVMAISSTNSNDNLSSFSNVGPEIELAAPGTDIYSTYGGGGYDALSGTSMAAPHVAGAAGQLMADGASNSAARQTLKDTAEDIELSSEESGAGLLDAEAAVSGDDGGGEPVLGVSTDSATGVGQSSATLNGSLTGLGGASSADVYFEWGEAGSGFPNTTSAQTMSSTGTFSEDLSGLSTGTDYEFRAVADASDGGSATGSAQSFTTGTSGGCFITTATAGEGATLDSLRRFRDESMSATPLGRGLVSLYYAISPPIAATLERHPESRTARATRRIVDACASLSDRQAERESRVGSASLGVLLTLLYVVGILVGAGGHAGTTARERLE